MHAVAVRNIEQAHGGSSENDLDLVLQILGHEPARAVHYYRVSHADVHSMIRVIQPFNRGGIVLQSNASITEWQGGVGCGWKVARLRGDL